MGSSSSRKSGSAKTSAARRIRVICPPDKRSSSVSVSGSNPTRASADASRASSVQSTSVTSSANASPRSARRSSSSAARAPNRSITAAPAGSWTSWRSIPTVPLTRTRPAWGMCSPVIAASSVVLPTPLRPTRPARSAPNVRLRSERRGRPSGVDSERFDRMIDAGMEFPVSKADGRCGRGEIHGCETPD
ncbi:hypothetical protein ABIB87_002192 [Bradyrhizobium sp. JR18.2]